MASLQSRTVSCQFESRTAANLFKGRSVIAQCQGRYFYKQPRYIVQPDKFRHFKPYFLKIVNNLSVKLKPKEIKLIRLLTATVFEYLIWIDKKFTIKFRLFFLVLVSIDKIYQTLQAELSHRSILVHTTADWEIWNRSNHRKFWISFEENLVREIRMVVVLCSVNLHTKTQSRRFQIPLVCRGFSKCSLIVTE